MVAWQFTARNSIKKTTRPVGHGLSWSTRGFTAYDGRSFLPTQSHRTLRDGSFFASIPGSELPGYLHSVPSGLQTSPTPVHISEAREISATSATSCSKSVFPLRLGVFA
jgi:hypothetical protein